MSGAGELVFKDELGRFEYGRKKKVDGVKILKQKPWLVTIGLVGVLMIFGGLVSFMAMNEGVSFDNAQGEEIMSVDSLDSARDKSFGFTQDKEIYVDVSGAVIKPGMYQLEGGARVNDALVASGGLSSAADRDWVSKNLNLAMKLADGQKLYIPQEGTTLRQGYEGQGGVAGSSITGLINVNVASVSELDTLWGVGEATAKKIIDGRPYGSVEELLTKKVVKSNVYEEIKDEISVY